MIVKRVSTILPSMTEEEALEVTKIYNAERLLKNSGSLITERSFRVTHYNESMNSLVGRGSFAMQGEITLLHNEILFKLICISYLFFTNLNGRRKIGIIENYI